MATDPKPCKKCGEQHVTRFGHPSCTGHKKDGSPCSKDPIHGARICGSHGVNKRTKVAAKKRAQEAEVIKAVAKLGLPREVAPADALLDEVHRAAGAIAYIETQLEKLEAGEMVWGTVKIKTGEHFETVEAAGLNVWIQFWHEARDRLVKACAIALANNIAEQRVELAKAHGALVADTVQRVLEALGLTPEQWQLVPTVVPRELRLLRGGAA